MKKEAGFTLVELMVVVVVVATVGTMVVNLFVINLRASAKSKALTNAKQNGDYALSVMERMIRNAQEVKSYCPAVGATSSSLQIVNPDKGITNFDCSGVQIASNSGIFLTSNQLAVKSGSCSFFCLKPQGKPAVVTVKFTLGQKSSYLGTELKAEVPFETTISTRTY